MGWRRQCQNRQNNMKKYSKKGCGSQGDWQLEVALIDLHIRQCQAVVREYQTQVKQLQAERAALLAPHKKKRRRTWDDDTPLYRLVNLSQLDHFKTLISDWQKRTTETIDPKKTFSFIFMPHAKSHAIRALALMLSRDVPVFKVSTLELCRYLSTHSNLGTTGAIRQALYRELRKL